MTNPVLVELTRGPLIESVHRGAIAIVSADGRNRIDIGDTATPLFPRSSLKPIQALPLIESGAAEAFGLTEAHIALACASHSGEPMHTVPILEWLARLGLGVEDLACGPHPVRHDDTAISMIRSGESPTALHNNCSGKHTGFLTIARHWDLPTAGYQGIEHPVQRAVAATLRDLSRQDDLPAGADGCGAPNFALPLSAFALSLAQLADPSRLPGVRANACRQIVRAMISNPELVSGTGRACAILMRAAAGKAAVKAGAEGFYAAIVPTMKLGIAVKIDDGAPRAAETAIAEILRQLGLLNGSTLANHLFLAPIRNTRGEVVGERRPTQAVSAKFA